MRRGGPLPPPRPRVPAASRQAPPFLPSEGQVFHPDSCDCEDQGLGKIQGLPRKEERLWKKGERGLTLPWDQQSQRSCGQLTEPSQRPPQAKSAFGRI